MTVIAGFQCLDALLMCADSEQTLPSDSKSQIRKLDSFVAGGAAVAIGGAGDVDVIEFVQYQLRKKLDKTPPEHDNAESWMEEFARDMWNAFMRPYQGLMCEPPGADFLIGLQTRGDPVLYKWERDMIHPLPKLTHTSIGSGIIQSEPLIADLDSFDLPAHQMLLYAVRAMLRVKQLVQGCGGKTEAVLLMNDGFIMRPATMQIDRIEHLVDGMDRFFLENCMRFIAGHAHAHDQEYLNEQVEHLKRFKQRYEKIVPDLISWYRHGEIRF